MESARQKLMRFRNGLLSPEDRRIAELEAENAALVEALRFWSDLVAESSGVAGWHQNGEIAPWGDWQDVIDGMNELIARAEARKE